MFFGLGYCVVGGWVGGVVFFGLSGVIVCGSGGRSIVVFVIGV